MTPATALPPRDQKRKCTRQIKLLEVWLFCKNHSGEKIITMSTGTRGGGVTNGWWNVATTRHSIFTVCITLMCLKRWKLDIAYVHELFIFNEVRPIKIKLKS